MKGNTGKMGRAGCFQGCMSSLPNNDVLQVYVSISSMLW
jgi:hypothetical protein